MMSARPVLTKLVFTALVSQAATRARGDADGGGH